MENADRENTAMDITVLGATGGTGGELVRQALERGHRVTAIARDPARIAGHSERLSKVAGDVLDPGSIARAVRPETVVLSGLGISRGEPAGTLTAGAEAVVAAHPARIIWLGAIGAGPSKQAAGRLSVFLLKTFMRAEYGDKEAADATVVAAGGTVFHAGPLSDRPLSATRRTVTLDDVPKRFFPAGISRATVAAAMLDEAETPRHRRATVVPLAGG